MFSYSPEKPDSSRPWLFSNGFILEKDPSVKLLAEKMSSSAWSPCVWKDGKRKEANFLGADWCGLDFDSGEMTLGDALKIFCDTIHVIGTTKNHGKEKDGRILDRFRVALKFEKRITDKRVFRWTMQSFMNRYPVDKQCKDAARFFWPCREIVSIAEDGYSEKVLEDVPENFEDKKYVKAVINAARKGVFPVWVEKTLSRPFPKNARNDTCYRISKDLTFVGFSIEQIVSLIAKSRPEIFTSDPKNPFTPKELTNTVTSGHRNAQLDMERLK